MATYSKFTLTNLIDRLSERVGNNSTFWVNAEKRDGIMEGVLIWQVLTGESLRTFTIPVTTGAFYDVPKQIDSVRKVTVGGVTLTPISKWELDMAYPNWQTTSGTPLYWSPAGLNKIGIYPFPTSGAIVFEGYSEVPILFNTGDVIQLNDDSVAAILDYAHHYCTLKEGGQEFADSSNLLRNFIKAAGMRNGKLLATEFYRHFMGQYRDETQFPSREDITGGIRS